MHFGSLEPTGYGDVGCKLTLLFLILVQAAPLDSTASTVPQRCGAGRSANDEIVVCVRRREGVSPYRINQPPAQQTDIPKAKVQLADGVSVSAVTEQADVGGFPSNRVMVRLKFKF